MEELVTCPVCSEVFAGKTKEPVVLHYCGHIFCRSCLLTLEAEKPLLECPTCRKIHLGQSVSDIPVLYAVQGLSDDYRKAKVNTGRQEMIYLI